MRDTQKTIISAAKEYLQAKGIPHSEISRNNTTLLFCAENRSRFNIKLSNSQIKIWTFSRRQIFPSERTAILEIANHFEQKHPDFHAYIDEDDILIISIGFSSPSNPEEAVNMVQAALQSFIDVALERNWCHCQNVAE